MLESPSSSTLRLGALSGLVAVLVLAGCGTSEEPRAESSSSPSPSVPAGLDTTAPEPPDPQADTVQGAEAYAAYFALLVQHAIRVRDSTPVNAEVLDQAACTTCRKLGQYVDGLRKQKRFELGKDMEVGRLTTTRRGAGYRVAGTLRYPATTYVRLDGTRVDEGLPGRYDYYVDLSWSEPRGPWRVREFKYLREPAAGKP